MLESSWIFSTNGVGANNWTQKARKRSSYSVRLVSACCGLPLSLRPRAVAARRWWVCTTKQSLSEITKWMKVFFLDNSVETKHIPGVDDLALHCRRCLQSQDQPVPQSCGSVPRPTHDHARSVEDISRYISNFLLMPKLKVWHRGWTIKKGYYLNSDDNVLGIQTWILC